MRDIDTLDNTSKALFLLLGLIAGIIHWGKRDLKNKTVLYKFLYFIYDCIVSGSIAIFTGLIVYSYKENIALSLGIGGIIGHIGTRAIYLAEIYVAEKLKSEEMKKIIKNDIK